MKGTSHYYLARLNKGGLVTWESITEAVGVPVQLERRNYVYSFTDASFDVRGRYVYAKLSKALPAGEVSVVDPDRHVTTQASIPNLVQASSSFVLVRDFSGLAYQHVWNDLERETFEEVFVGLVLEKHKRFFADLTVERIADVRSFVQKIAELDVVTKLDATVRPPNPLFGPLWAPLREYMKGRRAGKIQVSESGTPDAGLATDLPTVAESLGKGTAPEAVRSLIDAAVLMAADGYGQARVQGKKGRERKVVRTRDSQMYFEHASEPLPEALFEAADQALRTINDERGLKHP